MDHKWPVIAARSGVKVGIVSAIAWALLDYASQQQERGSVQDFDVEAYAIYSGFSQDEINAVIQAMKDKQVIVDDRFANWEKRQPKSEREIQRVTKYRKQRSDEVVTDCYAPLQNVTKNYTDTDTETDTETDNTTTGVSEPSPAGTTLPPPEPERPNLFAVYEREIGLLTPAVSDRLMVAEEEYPPGWAEAAMSEAARQNKRSWAYVEGILKRWKVDGFQSKKSRKPPGQYDRRRLLEGL